MSEYDLPAQARTLVKALRVLANPQGSRSLRDYCDTLAKIFPDSKHVPVPSNVKELHAFGELIASKLQSWGTVMPAQILQRPEDKGYGVHATKWDWFVAQPVNELGETLGAYLTWLTTQNRIQTPTQTQTQTPKPQESNMDLSSITTIINEAQSGLAKQAQEIADLQAENTKLHEQLAVAAAASAQTVQFTPAPNLNADERLQALEAALRGDLDLDFQASISEFRGLHTQAQPTNIWWPAWCDPKNPLSKLPFCVDNGLPVCLTGESGTGKTFVAESYFAHKYGGYVTVPCHEDMSWQELFLRTRVKNGHTYYVLGAIPMALITGMPTIIDEVGHLRSANQSQLHEAVDKFRCHLPELGQTLSAQQGFKMILTDNGLGDDTGIYDAFVAPALRTRLYAIKVQYPCEKDEAEIIKVQTGLNKAESLKIAKTFSSIRKLSLNPNAPIRLEGPFSTRESCNMGRIMRTAMQASMSEADAAHFASQLVLEDKRTVEQSGVIDDEVSKVFGKPKEGIEGNAFLAALAAEAGADSANVNVG